MRLNANAFTAEGKVLYNNLLDKYSAETLTMPQLSAIRGQVTKTLNSINEIDIRLKQQRSAYNRLRTLKRSMGFKGSVSSEQFLTAFQNFTNNRSKTLRTTEEVTQAIKELETKHNDIQIKSLMLKSYGLIMGVRNLFYNPIFFGTTLLTRNAQGEEQLLFHISASFEEVMGSAKLVAGGSLQIETTVGQLKQAINNIDVTNKYQNLLSNSETQKIWNTLTDIKKILNSHNVAYNYGQLVEALVYLSKKQNYNQTDIYQALIEGRNRVSFEVAGDFTIQLEDDLQSEIDIQSKLFNLLGPDDAQRRIRLLTISNCKRVLGNIQQAIVGTNIEQIKQNLMAVFSVRGNASGNWASPQISAFVANVVSDVYNNQLQIKPKLI